MQHIVDEMRHAAQKCREAAANYTRLSEKIESQERRRGRNHLSGSLDEDSIIKAIADRKEQSIRLKQFGGQRDFWSDEQQRLALHIMAEVAYAQHRRGEIVGAFPRMRTGGV